MKKTGLKIGALIASALLYTGCVPQTAPTDPSPSQTAEAEFEELYPTVPEDHVFRFASQDDVTDMMEHGTGIIYLGFPECQWCQAYVPFLNEAAEDVSLEVLYYDIREDRKENSDFYQSVIRFLSEQEETSYRFDADGKPRIYVPYVMFVSQGKVIAFDDETSMEDSSRISPAEYWTEEKIHAKKEQLSSLCAEIAGLREKLESQGCAEGCSGKPGE